MDTTNPAAAPTARIVRHPVSPEIAANIREEDEALAAAQSTARALVDAVVAEHNRLMAAARARHAAATRPILRALQIDEGMIVRVDGFGADTTIDVSIAIPADTVNNA